MVARPTRRRSLTLLPLSAYLANSHSAPTFFAVAFAQSGSLLLRRGAIPCSSSRGRSDASSTSVGRKVLSPSGATDENNDIGEGSDGDGDEDTSRFSFPDTLGQSAPVGVSPEKWERVLRSARDRQAEDDRLSPSPGHSPSHVATVTLQALRQNDVPYQNFGCEIAIRFSSTSNPASGFTPGGMRTYIDDPSMPFYRILGDWVEMGRVGDADTEITGPGRANQQIRVRREEDTAWSTVSMEFVREEGCWLIERLWIDDKSVATGRADGGGGGGVPPPRLTMAELFDEDRLEMMSCKYADYDPAYLGAAGGDWLEERPNPSLSPKAVALTCIISLRQNDDGSGATTSTNTSKSLGDDEVSGGDAQEGKSALNQGCERVIRFCSPTNAASTLTPAHFAQYLNEPWYGIFKEWDELSFHSEDISEDEGIANLVVLLRPEDEESWTSVNWELVKCDGMWLTERIWVVDV
ncbi:unnamed protein product [Scytosiphon promiscuus]